jgi:transposase
VIDVTEILVHWHAGRSQADIAASLGVDRKTVRKYTAPAIAAGLEPGGEPLTESQWVALVRDWFPELVDIRLRQSSWPAIEPFHDSIRMLMGEVTVSTIHQRLRDEHGLQVSLSSLRRYVTANLPEEAARAQVTVLRDDPPPGQEAQVDYGILGMWWDPTRRARRRVWAFVMVLATSRHLFVRPVLVMDQRAWNDAHVAAFDFFGGVPARIVPDNLKTGVTKPDLYDPKLNRAYAELGAHYGLLIDPARVFKPKDKARVERPMPYVRDSFWRGRQFTSVAQMQDEAIRWCTDVAGRRACRPLGGAAPAAVFAATEAQALAPLPVRPFQAASWSRPKVGPDIHVKVGGSLYSVPWRFIGRQLDARATDSEVQLFSDGQLVKSHAAAPGRSRRTDYGDYPPEKIAFHMRTPTWCRQRAEQIGPDTATLIAGLLEVNALFRLRAAQGILGLADKYTPDRLEAACGRALLADDPSYRTVKGILAAGTDRKPSQPRSAGDGGAAAHLRGPAALLTLFPDSDIAGDPSGEQEAS